MSSTAVAIAPSEYRETVDPQYIARVIRPYKPHSRYLRSAVISVNPDRECAVEAEGEFTIGESAYIESTGHFNAAELIMCVNQIGYVLVAKAVESRGFGVLEEQFSALSRDSFANKQLGGVLILKIEASFRRMIDPKRFRGRIGWKSVKATRRLIMLNGVATFSDDQGGRAEASALIGIVL